MSGCNGIPAYLLDDNDKKGEILMDENTIETQELDQLPEITDAPELAIRLAEVTPIGEVTSETRQLVQTSEDLGVNDSVVA